MEGPGGESHNIDDARDNMVATCHMFDEVPDGIELPDMDPKMTDWGRVAMEGIGYIAHERFGRKNEVCRWGTWRPEGKQDYCRELHTRLWDSYDLAASLANEQCPPAAGGAAAAAEAAADPEWSVLKGYDLLGWDKKCYHVPEDQCRDECGADEGCTGFIWLDQNIAAHGFCCHKHTTGADSAAIRWYGPAISYYEKAATSIRTLAGATW